MSDSFRTKNWDCCCLALNFFHDHNIPFHEMRNMDKLVGNSGHESSRSCFAKPIEIFLVYLPDGGIQKLELSASTGTFLAQWFTREPDET